MSGIEICDSLELCAPEYNMPELSDRVLVFDVMRDGWETASILKNNVSQASPDETTGSDGNQNRASQSNASQSDLCQSEASQSDLCQSEASQSDLRQSEASQKFEDSKADDVSTNIDPSPSLSVVRDFNGPLRQHKIFVHSFWLSVQSPFFRSLFYSSGMKECNEKEVHIKISESEEDAHLTITEAIYHGDVLNDKTVDEVLAVLELADKYELQLIFKRCKHILKDKNKTYPFEISLKILHVIKVKHDMDNVEDLLAILKPVLVQEFCPLDENWESVKFTNLEEPCLKYVLSSNELIVQSENTVFHALMYWMEQNVIDPGGLKETNDLLAVVRFKLVTVDYLYNVVRNHPIATRMPYFNEFYYDGLTYHALPSQQKKLFKEKPVPRKKTDKIIIQFVFAVKKEDYATALANESCIQTKNFWACGYNMRVGINPSDTENLFLIVHDLNKESYVPLRFAVFKETGYSQHRSKRISIEFVDHAFKGNSFRKHFKNKGNLFKDNINTLKVAVAPWDERRGERVLPHLWGQENIDYVLAMRSIFD